MSKYLHLTLDQRIEIQECLSHGMNFKAIGKRVKKDQTTISKEVKKHIQVVPSTVVKSKTEMCPSLLKPPFVCNACKRKRTECSFDKHFYYGNHANKDYRKTLSETREGVQMEPEAFHEIDKTIYDNMKKGQRLYHIMNTHELEISKSSVYRHINAGTMSAGRMDLPRAVKFKIRTGKRREYVPKKLKIGRTFSDFTAFHHGLRWILSSAELEVK